VLVRQALVRQAILPLDPAPQPPKFRILKEIIIIIITITDTLYTLFKIKKAI
jgi:hypothetical protein